MKLDGRRVIITGAGSGIGRASALAFAAEGARVLAGTGIRVNASDDASYVNGEALVIDGGLAAGLPMIPGKMW